MRVDHANAAASIHATRRPEPKAAGTTTDDATAAASPRPAPPQGSKASGVIDKLASGHFNDVAALRLRTNHAEAIAASGVELPDAPTETSRPGQGFAKALAAYQAAMPAVDPDPVAETLEDALAEPGLDGVDPLSIEPVIDTALANDVELSFPAPLDDGLIEALLDEPTEPVDVSL